MYSAFRTWCERMLRIPVDPEPPPGDESTARLFRAAPNYYKYLLVTWAIATVAVLAGELPMLIGPGVALLRLRRHGGAGCAAVLLALPIVVFVATILMRLVSLALVRLNFEKRWYLVTDRSLRVREGIVLVREMTVTFANIQNISISQGPIQRAIGIADLRVDTAGGGGGSHDKKQQGQDLHTAWFRGVNNADEIRQLIQDRLRHLKDSGLGDHEEAQREDSPARIEVSAAVIEALRQVHAEASALRRAA